MKAFKHLLVAGALVVVTVMAMPLINSESPVLYITALLSFAFFVFNYAVRKSLSYKGYFTSKYNVLTNKVWSEKAYDLPKELMFEKMIEVIEDSSFKLVDSNSDRFEILAISKITFTSWGENIYISFETRGEETIMKFCSSTFLGAYDWGKNEKNYNKLMNDIDLSFTI